MLSLSFAMITKIMAAKKSSIHFFKLIDQRLIAFDSNTSLTHLIFVVAM